MGDQETRVVDPTTGGAKGSKLAQLGAVDPAALMEVARVAGFGGQKYARYNFAKGFAWSLSYDAMQRHLHAFWGGQWADDESGLPHLAHAAWHCLCLITFRSRGLGTDDRFPAATSDTQDIPLFVDVDAGEAVVPGDACPNGPDCPMCATQRDLKARTAARKTLADTGPSTQRSRR